MSAPSKPEGVKVYYAIVEEIHEHTPFCGTRCTPLVLASAYDAKCAEVERLTEQVAQWERQTQGHVWVKNEEYSGLHATIVTLSNEGDSREQALKAEVERHKDAADLALDACKTLDATIVTLQSQIAELEARLAGHYWTDGHET